jgi:hypothetical protein
MAEGRGQLVPHLIKAGERSVQVDVVAFVPNVVANNGAIREMKMPYFGSEAHAATSDAHTIVACVGRVAWN